MSDNEIKELVEKEELSLPEWIKLANRAAELIELLFPILGAIGKNSTWAEQLEKWEAIKNQTEPKG